MRRLTTPTHRFTLPLAVSDCKEVLITYAQGSRRVLDKRLADMEADGNTVVLHLTQEDTAKFAAASDVDVQVRVLTLDGDALASVVMRIAVKDVLNDEVLE